MKKKKKQINMSTLFDRFIIPEMIQTNSIITKLVAKRTTTVRHYRILDVILIKIFAFQKCKIKE